MVLVDSLTGDPITRADVFRELGHIRADLSRLYERRTRPLSVDEIRFAEALRSREAELIAQLDTARRCER